MLWSIDKLIYIKLSFFANICYNEAIGTKYYKYKAKKLINTKNIYKSSHDYAVFAAFFLYLFKIAF